MEVPIKTRSIPASLSFKGQATKLTTVKWSFSSSEPLVFRLKMSLTSGSGRAKKFEFFHWLKMNAHQK